MKKKDEPKKELKLYEIKNRWDGTVLYSDKAESFEALILAAIKASANLYGANLTSADLRSANLYGADLRSANLTSANLRSANLTSADLRSANLTSADLRSANLYGANLTSANLYGADLRSANLYGANLTSANLRSAGGIYPIVPEEGSFIGFKKLANGTIAKLLIPEDAERVGGYTGRKCRASKAIVLEGSGNSAHDSEFTYTVGEIVTPDKWDNDPRVECSSGIHFFLTRREAQYY